MPSEIFGIILAFVVVWIAYCFADNEVASPLCKCCGLVTHYEYCILCEGTGKRKFGKKEVTCYHHRFLRSCVVCKRCQLMGRS